MPSSSLDSERLVLEALKSVRRLIGMEVAFISEFAEGRRVFRYVDSLSEDVPVRVGASDPLEDSYCQRVVDGRLPELMHDASRVAEARTLPVTAALPVGAHLSVPIRLSDGRVYGTFCCFSRRADNGLGERDVKTLRCFADMTARFIEEQVVEEKRRRDLLVRHASVLEGERFHAVYQPIVRLLDGAVIGHEALTRFIDEPIRAPDLWFNEAAEIGLQAQLEAAAIDKALRALRHLPAQGYLSLNASPQTLLSGVLEPVLGAHPFERLILEVTEHASVDDYSTIARAIEPLRKRGLRIAVDDAGAGFASFRHILKLQPEVIKLDNSLIRQIDSTRQYRALAAAVQRFAEQTGSAVVAEGVEAEAQLQVLRDLGVGHAQGYLLGRPRPIEDLLEQRG